MQSDLSINSIHQNQQKTTKSTDQQFKDQLTNYLKSEERDIPPKQELDPAVKKLINKNITIRNFSKSILNSTNTNDLKTLTNIAENLKIDVLKETNPQNSTPNYQTQNSKQNASRPPSPTTNPQITITSAEDQILANSIFQLLKNGKPKEALLKLGGNSEVLEKLIESLGKETKVSQQLIHAINGFITQALATIANPSVLEQLKEKYEKERKHLKNIVEGTETDSEELSKEAKHFTDGLKSVFTNIKHLGENIPKELSDTYNKLLDIIGMEED